MCNDLDSYNCDRHPIWNGNHWRGSSIKRPPISPKEKQIVEAISQGMPKVIDDITNNEQGTIVKEPNDQAMGEFLDKHVDGGQSSGQSFSTPA